MSKLDKIIALDIGGTNTRVAVVDRAYKVESIIVKDTKVGNLQVFLDSVKDIILELVPNPEDYLAISIGVPGRVRFDGYIAALPNIGISEIPLADYLHEAFKIPCFVRNDAEMAALAEAVAGPYHVYKSLYFITISTGVGGALTIGGKLRNSSYEIGHTLFTINGETHEFEHLASGSYLPRLAAMHGLQISGARDFFRMVRDKEEKAMPVYRDWISLFSQFINMIQADFQPDIFTLTGGVMKSSDVFFSDLVAACPDSKIVPCHYDQEAGLIGAAVYGYQKAK